MRLSEYEEQSHEQAYNEGWNSAAAAWDLQTVKLAEPKTLYTGQKRESFIEGFRACQDDLLLNEEMKP